MLRIIKWIGVPALAVALLAGLDAPKAEAGNGFSLRIGGFGISTGNYGYRTSVHRADTIRTRATTRFTAQEIMASAIIVADTTAMVARSMIRPTSTTIRRR